MNIINYLLRYTVPLTNEISYRYEISYDANTLSIGPINLNIGFNEISYSNIIFKYDTAYLLFISSFESPPDSLVSEWPINNDCANEGHFVICDGTGSTNVILQFSNIFSVNKNNDILIITIVPYSNRYLTTKRSL